MLCELILVELATISGVIHFVKGETLRDAVCRNCDVPFFKVAVFITVVKEEAHLLFHVLAHNDEQVRFWLMYRRRTVIQGHELASSFIQLRNAIKELLLAVGEKSNGIIFLLSGSFPP